MKAVVTGASQGIGGATALALARQCRSRGEAFAAVLSASGSKAPPDELLSALRGLDAEAHFVPADLGSVQGCDALAKAAHGLLGGIDSFVSNAGATAPGALATLSVQDWDRMFDVNVRATFLLAQAFRAELARSRGSIVAVASTSGIHPHRGHGGYSSAKAALIMLCRQMAQEWAGDGIRVNVVAPGLIHTPLTASLYSDADLKARREAIVPLGRIGTPQDVAEVVAFLAGGAAAYVTGQVVAADGGLADTALGWIPGLPRRNPFTP